MTHLKHVHMDSSSGVTSQGIKCLYSLPHLESLELKGRGITDCTLEGIGAASSTLKFLYLNQAAVTDAGLPHLASLTSLKTLILYKCEGVTCAGMVLAGRLTSLEELYLFGSGVKDHGLQFLVRAGSASLHLLRTTLAGVEVSKDLLPAAISGDAS
ncbi:unnamed protein product [Closterium sp. NIES-54]